MPGSCRGHAPTQHLVLQAKLSFEMQPPCQLPKRQQHRRCSRIPRLIRQFRGRSYGQHPPRGPGQLQTGTHRHPGPDLAWTSITPGVACTTALAHAGETGWFCRGSHIPTQEAVWAPQVSSPPCPFQGPAQVQSWKPRSRRESKKAQAGSQDAETGVAVRTGKPGS